MHPTSSMRLLAACLLPLAACAASPPGPVAATVQPDPISTELALETFEAVWGAIEATHFDPEFNGVDWPAVHGEFEPRVAEVDSRGELEVLLAEMVARLGQSHFSVIPARALPGAGADEDSEGAGGTGARAQRSGSPGFDVRLRADRLLVSEVDPEGAAFQAGVRPGWILLRAADVSIGATLDDLSSSSADLTLRDLEHGARGAARAGMQGPVGSEAEFVFLDASDREVALNLERTELGVIPHDFGTGLPTFHLRFRDEILERDGLRVGRIHFTNWFLPMMRPIDEAIDRMRDADGIVIDLRGNSGGAGAMTMGLAGHFFEDRRELGTQTMRDGKMIYVAMPRFVSTASEPVRPYAGPLALLIDETTGSASEVFSGGLQSTGRARVFGETSAGAVLPATTTMLPNGDALLHALGDFRTSTGVALEGRGVVPDETVVLTRADLLAGRDAQLEAALTWIAGERRP